MDTSKYLQESVVSIRNGRYVAVSYTHLILVLISNIEVGDARQFVPWPVSLPGENRYFRNSFIGA